MAQGTTTAPAAEPGSPEHELTPRFQAGDEVDEILDSDISSSTASIASSILKYRTVNRRTYHSDRIGGQYWGPNDDAAKVCLDALYHAFTLLIDGKLSLAPLPDHIDKALDIGTGTGIWAMDFADLHPDTTVIGTDLSPIQPTWVPPNLVFEIENFEQWSFDEKTVDYIHLRYVVGAVRNWSALFKDIYNTLKPGGFFESYDFDATTYSDDGTLTPDMALARWGSVFQAGFDAMGAGVCFDPIRDGLIRKALEEAGFVNIVEKPIKVPYAEWAADPILRDVGLYVRAAFEQDARGGVNMPAAQLGWSDEKIAVYCSRLRKEMRNLKIHAYFKGVICYAQRPLDS